MGDVNKAACPTVMPTKDTPGAASSVYSTTSVAIYIDDGPGYTISTDDVMAVPGHAMSTEDASGAASPVCPAVDVPATWMMAPSVSSPPRMSRSRLAMPRLPRAP